LNTLVVAEAFWMGLTFIVATFDDY